MQDNEKLPPWWITVVIDEDNFTIKDATEAWIFRAPLDMLVLQLCVMTPGFAQYVMPNRR